MLPIKSTLLRPYASFVRRTEQRSAANPHAAQQRVLDHLRTQARRTAFGRDHDLGYVHSQRDLAHRVPVRSYEDSCGSSGM